MTGGGGGLVTAALGTKYEQCSCRVISDHAQLVYKSHRGSSQRHWLLWYSCGGKSDLHPWRQTMHRASFI